MTPKKKIKEIKRKEGGMGEENVLRENGKDDKGKEIKYIKK